MMILLQGAHRRLPSSSLSSAGVSATGSTGATNKRDQLADFRKAKRGGKAEEKLEKLAFELTNDRVMIKTHTTTATTPTSSKNIWEEETSVLPNWLKEYFSWHKKQREKLIEEWEPILNSSSDKNQKIMPKNETEMKSFLWNQTDYRFFVIRCFNFDRKCGGLADRLLPLPYLLQVAHNSSRLLFIHFQKPAPLEEYLTPPQGGIDWRIPDWLLPAFPFTPDSRRFKAVGYLEWHANHFPDTVVQSIFQAFHYGAIPYNERKLPHEPSFHQVVRDAWRVMFTPVKPIQQIIQKQLHTLQLQEGQYASIHIRALYAVKEHQRNPADIQAWTRNAIHCASQLYPQGPFYLTSDSNQATQTAIEYGKQLQLPSEMANNNTRNMTTTTTMVRTRTTAHNKTPHHFDRIPTTTTTTTTNTNTSSTSGTRYYYHVPSDYYDTYVDLMLLAMGHCVTYGVGGYGKLASFLSHNHTCASHHFKKRMNRCDWNHPQQTPPKPKTILPSLLAPPMDPGDPNPDG